MMSLRSSSKTSNDIRLAPSMNEITPRELKAKIIQARRGLAVGLKPDLVLEGSGGTYFMKDASRSKVGVFKPADEEPYAENNPRGYLRQPDEEMTLRAGIVPGQSCIRELAAYLIDHNGFSGVPMTTLVEAQHPAFNTNGSHLNVSQGGAAMGAHSIFPSATSEPNKSKLGSFQEFVKHECTIDDVSPSKISREEVHKIAILDIRIMNADRNAANLLVRRKLDNSLELIPIDHGYCLRSVCDVSWMDWCWLDWPQIKEPLCDAHKNYIQNIDIEADVTLLRDRLNICEEAIDYFRASSTLLKAGVAAGLTLYDIAILCCRNDNLAEEPSMMERLFDMASELAHVALENERWHHSAASRALVDQLIPRPHKSYVDNNNHARRFSRSISSIEMSKLPSHPSDHSLNRDENLELMAALSDSDSSSDIAEDCNEWAAELIADLTEFKISPPARPNRSLSVGSDDSSADGNTEGSAKGFWVIAPGSAKAKESEHDSVQWTPKLLPRVCNNDFEVEHLDLDLPLSDGNVPEISCITKAPKSPSVSFAMNSRFIPPATVNVANYKADTLTKTNDDFDSHKADMGSNGMIRSKSYSTLPATSVSRSQGRLFSFLPSLKGSSPYKGSTEYEIYRTYFHKFIDLVIVRETTNALHHSKRAS